LTDAKVLGISDIQGHECVGLPGDLEHGKVMIRVDANDARVTGGLIVQDHLYGIRTIDDVIIGDNMSLAVPYESGSRPLRHFEGIERPDIPTDRRIGDVNHRLRGCFKDGNGIEFFRTERFLGDEVQIRVLGGNRWRLFRDELLPHDGVCGGRFAASGAIELDGSLPINTAGGNLSEGYIHGLNHIVEGVRQIRGTSTSQVGNAETCLVTSGLPPASSAMILVPAS
jgi:hypothetical protein